MSRPLLSKSIDQLEALFAKSKDDPQALRFLEQELAFRKTPRARTLLGKAQLQLCRRSVQQHDSVQAEADSARADHTLSAKPTEVSPPRSTPPADFRSAPGSQRSAEGTFNSAERTMHQNYANRPVDLLDAWTALEVLSPQTYRREADLASGLPSNIISIADGRLPWDRAPAPSKPKLKVFFHLVLGTIAAGPVYEALVQKFGDTREERPSAAGNIVLASILVDKNGVPAGDAPVSISAFGWGFPLALRGSLKELAAWTSQESRLIDGLTKQLPREGSNGELSPIAAGDLQRAFAWLVHTLGLPADQVEGPRFAVRAYLHFTSKIVPDPLLLNSFFLRDLARAKEGVNSGRMPAALAAYLGASKPRERRDLLNDAAALEASQAPGSAPLGRWPTPPHHIPSLLQQSAVNLAGRLHGKQGIVAVNGPPGTGKSTLLRDIVADVVTRRAKAMSAFAEPSKAFRVGWTKRARGEIQELYSLDPSLRGFEVVVASSNNKAVENISTEMPGLSALPADSDLRYFAPLAQELVGREAWGLVAAVMGNASNRSRFRKGFWTESPLSFKRYLERAAGFTSGDGSSDLADQCNAPTGPQDALTRWHQARTRFLELASSTERRLAELESLRRALLSLPSLVAGEALALRRLTEARELAEGDADRLRASADDLEQAQKRVADCQMAVGGHQEHRPNWVMRLFRTPDAKAWTASSNALGARHNAALGEQAAAATANAEARQVADASSRAAVESARELVKAQSALSAARSVCESVNVGSNACRMDDAFHALSHTQKQLSLPWLDTDIQRLRSDMFSAAIGVHKAFIDAAALPLLRNLNGIMDALFGNIPPDRTHLAGDLWSSLFLVVPVVSTTFASVERMLGRLPPETFGWLLIDEAGQASPQSAVGALMRCQRAVVVGDPQQVEPVVLLPDVLTTAVMREFSADSDLYAAPASSVQTLADEASDHCATFQTVAGTRTVGTPLLVHRRCSSPMFEVSNTIAYGGLMVQAKQPTKSAIRAALGPSRWIDVRGTGRDKYCIEEGEALLTLLRELRGAGALPDIYVVTPFVAVQDGLRQLVAVSGVLNGWAPDASTWPRERIGTVHTVQGREAEAVILVLGAPLASQNGARQWAGRLPNLLNVAVTRAKESVYVVGNRELWSAAGHFSVLDELLQRTPRS